MIETNRPELYQVVVDARGAIELPQLGRIVVMGQTTEEATDTIKLAMNCQVAASSLVPRRSCAAASADVQPSSAASRRLAPYFIPRPDYRLLEAITAGGRVEESVVEDVFIIRQVPLSDDVTSGQGPRRARRLHPLRPQQRPRARSPRTCST